MYWHPWQRCWQIHYQLIPLTTMPCVMVSHISMVGSFHFILRHTRWTMLVLMTGQQLLQVLWATYLATGQVMKQGWTSWVGIRIISLTHMRMSATMPTLHRWRKEQSRLNQLVFGRSMMVFYFSRIAKKLSKVVLTRGTMSGLMIWGFTMTA